MGQKRGWTVGNFLRTGLCVASAVVVLVGCDKGVEGSPTTTAAAPSFDPCSIPSEALNAVDVDPSSADDAVIADEPEGWKYCRWIGDNFGIGVIATTKSIDQFRSNPTLLGFQDVAIGDRVSLVYRFAEDTERSICSVAMPSGQEAVVVRIYSRASGTVLADPCASLINIADEIEPFIPT